MISTCKCAQWPTSLNRWMACLNVQWWIGVCREEIVFIFLYIDLIWKLRFRNIKTWSCGIQNAFSFSVTPMYGGNSKLWIKQSPGLWWRHQMGTFSALLALCEWNSPVTGEFPAKRPGTRSFDFFLLIGTGTNAWVNNRDAGDLRRHSAHYDVTMIMFSIRLQRRISFIYVNITFTFDLKISEISSSDVRLNDLHRRFYCN